MHVRRADGDAEQLRQGGQKLGGVVRVKSRQLPAHPLRPPGGARRVVHGGARGPPLRQGGGLTLADALHRAEPGHVPVADPPAGRHARLLGGPGPGRAVPLVHEERLRLAVAHDVGDLRGGEVPVDGGDVPAGLQRGQVDLERRDPVGRQHGHAVPGLQALGPQAVGELVDPGQQVACGVRGAVRLDRCDPSRVGLGAPPEAERSHGPTSRGLSGYAAGAPAGMQSMRGRVREPGDRAAGMVRAWRAGKTGRRPSAWPPPGGTAPMPVALAAALFVAGAAVSLSTSYVLVTRLERIGERLGLSEALLGVVAALAADTPEITSAVAALASHQSKIGAGVIIGSNVFNLAALLGLGAVVAGGIALHRRVVLLGGVPGIWIAVACLVTVLAVLVPYLAVLGAGHARLQRFALARRWESWLAAAVTEEEQDLEEVIHPPHGRGRDVAIAAAALVVVVLASVTMERAASLLGARFAVPEIITGGVVLAAVTSLPNAVAAVYLAARGRGAAMLSTTLNSNALNVTAGLLIPAAITGLGPPSADSVLIAVWYLVLTLASLAFAYRDGGVSRATGALIIGAYLVFLGSLLATAHSASPDPRLTVVPLVVVAAGAAAGLARRPGRKRGRERRPP